jgi:hypothetical protein
MQLNGCVFWSVAEGKREQLRAPAVLDQMTSQFIPCGIQSVIAMNSDR